MKFQKGLSLLEILVVISIFSILGILITRSVLLTLGGGKKSESLIKVRENLSYATGVIERQLRNANSIIDCTNTDTNIITYLDQKGTAATFSCVNVGANTVGYVASGAASLASPIKITNDSINITKCEFTCTKSDTGPSSVTINFEAQDATAQGADNSVVTSKDQVFLRNY